MKEADVVLTAVPQGDGAAKNRPALLLRELRPFGDFLVCGVSTQLHMAVPDFDDVIRRSDADFNTSHLQAVSVLAFGERTSPSWYGTIVLGVLAVTLANWDAMVGVR